MKTKGLLCQNVGHAFGNQDNFFAPNVPNTVSINVDQRFKKNASYIGN